MSTPPGRMIERDGCAIHVWSSGEQHEGTTVVVEAGMGCCSLDWSIARPLIAEFANVVTYDRPGYGFSAASDAPRDAATIVDELRALLTSLGHRPPYLAVGHSFGGWVMRLFARTYADEVAGLVLLDPGHEDWWSPEHFPEVWPSDWDRAVKSMGTARNLARVGILGLFARLGLVPGLAREVMKRLPADVRKVFRDKVFGVSTFDTWLQEAAFLEQTRQQVRAAPALRADLPLRVLIRGQPLPTPRGLAAGAYEQPHRVLMRALAAQSSRGAARVVEGAEHNIQVWNPSEVAIAVREVSQSLEA